jgi:hypothetical protein
MQPMKAVGMPSWAKAQATLAGAPPGYFVQEVTASIESVG